MNNNNDRFSDLNAEKLASLFAVGMKQPPAVVPESPIKQETTQNKSNADSSSEQPQIAGYQILSEISRGGMGTVFRAVQLSANRQVALKVLTQGKFACEKNRLRFEREVELTARLEHPNIARIYDSGIHKGMYYYTMELFEGQRLDAYVHKRRLSQEQILDLVYIICQAVGHAHQRAVIHRDLKPSNIIVTDDGQPHLVDFGLARTVLESDKGLTVSVDGDIAGTPAYMSPEQAQGEIDALDTRTDIYSLGVILFQLLTGRLPYDDSGSNNAVLNRIRENEPFRPSRIIPRFDPDLESILLKALEKRPRDRYQSVVELARDVQAQRRGLPVSARPITVFYLMKKMMLRNRITSMIVSLLIIILVANSFISLYFYFGDQRRSQESENGQIAWKNYAMLDRTIANQASFLLFLERLHDGRRAEARNFAEQIRPGSRERIAVAFLLYPKPLMEQEATLLENLGSNQTAFLAFIFAERHRQNQDKDGAAAAYRLFLAKSDPTDSCRWYIKRACDFLQIPLPSPACPARAPGT